MSNPAKIFVSYSHKNVNFLNRLRIHLASHIRLGLVDCWDDTRLSPGKKWRDEISQAIDTTEIAVLLISADFLASSFIATYELPELLNNAEKHGLSILPVFVEPCSLSRYESIRKFQGVNKPDEPLSRMSKAHQEEFWAKLVDIIDSRLIHEFYDPYSTVEAVKGREGFQSSIAVKSSIGKPTSVAQMLHDLSELKSKPNKPLSAPKLRRRIYLSTPHMTDRELSFVKEVFDSNWIATFGPSSDKFEHEFSRLVGSEYGVALSSGSAALHLALVTLGVKPGDEVFLPTFAFVNSANCINYVGGLPTFIDSEDASWNIDPALLRNALKSRARTGRPPKAVIVVHAYGQPADIDAILAACNEFDVPLIENASEALGATYNSKPVGSFGRIGVYDFGANRIVTTSTGGMLVSADEKLIISARYLASQARDPAPHYEHSHIGYDYRMSGILAAIGIAQIEVLNERVAARRQNFEFYSRSLSDIPGLNFMPEASWRGHSRWLTCIMIDPKLFGCNQQTLRLELENNNIEARPLWKPLHMQPIFRNSICFGGAVAEHLFEIGLAIPSGSNLTQDDLGYVVEVIRRTAKSYRI